MVSESGAVRFLGIIKKADKLKCGDAAVFAACDMGKARAILTAADAAEVILRKVRFNLPPGTVHIELPFSKAEIGAALGSSEIAVAVITEHGMAAAFTEKLSQEFPGKYEAQLDILTRKAAKVVRRRKEKADEKKSRHIGAKKSAKGTPEKEENL